MCQTILFSYSVSPVTIQVVIVVFLTFAKYSMTKFHFDATIQTQIKSDFVFAQWCFKLFLLKTRMPFFFPQNIEGPKTDFFSKSSLILNYFNV